MEVDLNVNIETKKLLEEMNEKMDKQQEIINNLQTVNILHKYRKK